MSGKCFKRNRAYILTALLGAAAVMLPAAGASANVVTNHWNVPGNGYWGQGSNWSQTRIPGADTTDEDDTYIMNGSVVTVNNDFSAFTNVRYLNLNAAYAQAHGGTSHETLGTTLTVTGNGKLAGMSETRVGGGATLNIAAGGSVQSGAVKIGGGTLSAQATVNVSGDLVLGNLKGTTPKSGNTLSVGSVLNLKQNGLIVTGNYGKVSVGNGTFNQTGGELDTGRMLYIGDGANTDGTYNFSGGDIYVGYDGNYGLRVGNGGNGTFTMTGGTLHVGTTINVGASGSGMGLMTVSDGVINSSDSEGTLIVGNSGGTGSGTFRVSGSNAAITLNTTYSYAVRQYENGTLNFEVGSNGVTTIVTSSNDDSRATINLAGTLDMDLLGNYQPIDGQQFVLLTTDNIASVYGDSARTQIIGAGIITDAVTYYTPYGSYTNAGLSLAPEDVANWTYAVDPIIVGGNTTGYQLVATYSVPEPASGVLVLLGLGGLLMLPRRRRVTRC